MTRFARLLATTGYLGNRLPAPGTTAGSIPALILYWLLVPRAVTSGAGAWGFAAFTALFSLLGVWAAGEAEKTYGHDANAIVVDEVAGMWIALLFLPKTVMAVGAAFVLFRAFDIVKPFPAGRAQHLPGGWGVVADDVMAAIYANIGAHIVAHFTGA